MVERRRGSVVVIGSMTGKRPLPGRTPYAASKTALIGLVRTLAWDAGRHGVRVPLARFAAPGDVVAAVHFLCSDAAALITGEDLNVSAGTVMYG